MHYWKEHDCENPKHLSPLNLAFIGDAVYGVAIRERILADGNRPVSDLHREAVRFVCAQAQSLAYDALSAVLNEEEEQILKRGRNCSSVRTPKSSSMIEYRRVTAVEALIGYLYLKGEEGRLGTLMELAYRTILETASSAQESEEACTVD